MPPTSSYFAYGSNLHFPQLQERAPSALALGVAQLPGYRLAFTRNSTRWTGLAADVVPDPTASVYGALYSLHVEDLAGLDRSEFQGSGYRRVEVEPIFVSTGTPIAALTYEVINKQPEGKPPPAYLAQIIEGAKATGLPASWLDLLDSFN